VILCLRDRCDTNDVILPPDLVRGQRVRVKQGVFEGCEGIIQEKRGNRRIQLLLEMAYGPSMKVELGSTDVIPLPVSGS
jgi:transcription antitermination factor NusG